jgi:hypothetical protein
MRNPYGEYGWHVYVVYFSMGIVAVAKKGADAYSEDKCLMET